MTPDITAVLCTHNRAAYLKKAIASFGEQSLPRERYEVIVVDNGSTDETRTVVDAAARQAGNVRRVHEPVLGLSQARNTGWRAADSEIVAYMDDDGIASPGWLEGILRCFETVRPRPGCVTGKIEPIWEVPRPPWVDDRLLYAFSITDWSPTPLFLGPEQWMAGCNISFPRAVLEEVGGFATELGRRGKSLLSDEEHLMRQEFEAKGYRCYYDPAVLVRHHVPAERTTKAWLRRRSFWQGISIARRAVLCDAVDRRRRMRMVGRLLGRLLGTPYIVANMFKTSDDPRRFALKCRTWNELGQIVTLLGFRCDE